MSDWIYPVIYSAIAIILCACALYTAHLTIISIKRTEIYREMALNIVHNSDDPVALECIRQAINKLKELYK